MSITNLAEWRAARTVPETLPSGLPVLLKRNVQLIDVAAQGDIPEPLIPQVEVLINQSKAGPLLIEVKDLPRHAGVIDLVVKAVLVDPPVADEADDTHIALRELDFYDRMWIFNWAHGGASSLATFPEPARARTPRGRDRVRPAAIEPAEGLVDGLADRPGDPVDGDAGLIEAFRDRFALDGSADDA
jgi:hypothetical protein